MDENSREFLDPLIAAGCAGQRPRGFFGGRAPGTYGKSNAAEIAQAFFTQIVREMPQADVCNVTFDAYCSPRGCYQDPHEWIYFRTVKGPIPGEWVSRAAKLPGRVLHVGLALWFLAGMEKCRTVKPTWRIWRRFSVSPDTGRRGLAELERAGLVSVDRHPGRCPLVTIREWPSENA